MAEHMLPAGSTPNLRAGDWDIAIPSLPIEVQDSQSYRGFDVAFREFQASQPSLRYKP